MQAYCTATLTVDLELIFYSNPTHEDCDGGHCESTSTAMCDNKFDFCVRAAGNDTCLTPVVSTSDLDSDTITFSPFELSELEINNPIQFSSIATSVSVSYVLQLLAGYRPWSFIYSI